MKNKSVEYEGKVANLAVPQYAFHLDDDTGDKSPVIVMQADTNGDFIAIGFQSIVDRSVGVGLDSEFEFLVTSVPDDET